MSGAEYTVVGIAANPLIFDRLGESSSSDGETLGRIVYFSSEFSALSFPVTDIYIRLNGLEERLFFGRVSGIRGLPCGTCTGGSGRERCRADAERE